MKFTDSTLLHFSSDFHFGHKSICSGTSRWEDKSACRVFESVEDMDNTIIENINNQVKKDDVFFFMGDFTLGDYRYIKEYRDRINCVNIHLVLGNHDCDLKRNRKDCRNLFSSVTPALEIKVGEQRISLSHYAFRTWNQAHRSSWHLYGHSHNNLAEYSNESGEKYKTFDVGIDSAFKKLGFYKPFSYQEVEEIMNNRISLGIDHHI